MFMDILSIEQVFLINISIASCLKEKKNNNQQSVTTTRPPDAAEDAPTGAPCGPMGTLQYCSFST